MLAPCHVKPAAVAYMLVYYHPEVTVSPYASHSMLMQTLAHLIWTVSEEKQLMMTACRNVEQYPQAAASKGVLILRVSGPLCFANVEPVKDKIAGHEVRTTCYGFCTAQRSLYNNRGESCSCQQQSIWAVFNCLGVFVLQMSCVDGRFLQP